MANLRIAYKKPNYGHIITQYNSIQLVLIKTFITIDFKSQQVFCDRAKLFYYNRRQFVNKTMVALKVLKTKCFG